MVGKIGRAGSPSKDDQITVAGNKLKQSWFHAANLFFSLFIFPSGYGFPYLVV